MLSVKNIGYETAGHEVFRNVSFAINKGDRLGLVGKNGVGKTTLLHLLSGDLEPTQGEIVGNDTEVGLMPQDLGGWLDKPVYDFLESVTGVQQAREDFDEACRMLQDSTSDTVLAFYADALEKYEKYDVPGFESKIEKALAAADMEGIDVTSPLKHFSGGQRTRIALAGIFASQQDVVLLDEPTNNLDSKGIEALEGFIDTAKGAFVMVSHDRRFLRNATNRIVELLGEDRGVEQYGLGYDEYMESRQADRAAVVKRYDQYETEKKRLKKVARDASIRANGASSGRRKAPDNDKSTANFRAEKAASGLARAAQSIESRAGQLEEPERPEEEVSLKFLFKEADAKKLNLLTVNELTVTYLDGFTAGPLSLSIRSGERYALNGPNGIGKSSLLRAIVGKSAGEILGGIAINKEAHPIYIDQEQSLPLMDGTAFDNIKHMAPHLEVHEAINLLIRFNLKKDIISTTRGRDLSGGERAKVLLASIAANKANLLLLDEPTNNLDLATVEALESAIASYEGGVVVVSHDREFLEALGITHEINI
ncbi:MAG: ABC-F family ATP-binding cassette domain-containing protein [Candidatus Microsaccharimonas sp.]